MARTEQNGASRSRAIYGLLLELYPRPNLQRHRAEMLLNFRDLEQASPSKAELWLFLTKDLVVSLRSQFIKTLWGQTAIVVVLAVLSRVPAGIRSLPAQALIVVSVLALVIAVAGIGSGAQSHVVWALCYGFLLAWSAGWVGNRWQTRP